MPSKKILILYTSTGLGHKSIAENMGYMLEQAGYIVKLADGYELQPSKQLDSYNKLHMWVYNHASFIWRWLYNWAYFPMLPLRVFMARFHHDHVLELVNQFEPDLIISTQVSVSAVVAYLKRKGLYKNLFAISFSDFHLHRFWLYPEADYYLTNIPEQGEQMQKLGIPAGRVFNCGITLKPELGIDASAVKQKFGIAGSEKVILLAGGSLGFGLSKDLLAALARPENLSLPAKIIVVCGQSLKLRTELEKNYGNRLIVLGYHTLMEELYVIADIFVSKPGGLSVAEALRTRLPMLVTYFLPGQEEKNARFLLGKKWIINPSLQSLSIGVEKSLSIINNELTRGEFKKSLLVDSRIQTLVQPQAFGGGVVPAVRAMFHG